MSLMSGKGGGKNALASKPNLLNALRVQTSSYGQVVPILYGQNRISGRLIWCGDFTPVAHTSTQKVGGKGLGSSGNNVSQTTYTYQTAVATALCMGPIQNMYAVWDTKGRLTLLTTSVPFSVPGGGGMFTPSLPPGATFHSGFGVSRQDSYSVNANDFGSDGLINLSGTQHTRMVQVGSGPSTGQYALNAVTGQHTFSSGDAGKVMTISFVYSVPDSSSNGQPLSRMNLTLFLGQRPQTPWSYLTSAHPGQDLGYNGIAYVASAAMDLGDSGALPNLSYEVLGLLPFGGGITDAEPSGIIADLVNNQFYGLGSSLPLGDLIQYQNFNVANGIFLSPVLDAQKSAAEWIQEILDVTNAAPVWSEGVLKIVPYGDTTAVGNGVTFVPNTFRIYDLTNTDLLEPVTLKRPSVTDVNNSFSIEFVNRANDYNVDVAEDKDEALIALYGLRKAQPKQAHLITTAGVAKFVANLLRKREVEIRNTYTLKLGWQFNLLEPMDLVTLTIPELGYNQKPVRITNIREDDTGQLEIDAEDFPWGTSTATLYPQQGTTAFAPQTNADPGNVNAPIVFEAPSDMSRSGQHEIWMAVSGGVNSDGSHNANWGGCSIWLSQDNSEYHQIGKVVAPARTGTLTATVNAITDSAQGNLASAFNETAIWTDGTAFGATSGIAASQFAISAAFVGSSLSFHGTPFNIGTANVANAVHGTGQTITLPGGKFAALRLLAIGVNGSQASQSFQINYTDATHDTFVQSLSDWFIPQAFSGETQVLAMLYRNRNTGARDTFSPFYLYGYEMAVNPAKTVASITLPNNANVIVLAITLANPVDPDAVNYFPVDLSQSAGILLSGTLVDADSYRTLCWCDGELIAYKDVNLTSAFHYDVGRNGAGSIYVRRGLFGSKAVGHASGATFVRLDDAVFTYIYDPAFLGKTIYLKFTSFNASGMVEQSLANASAYQFIVTGKFCQMETAGKNLLANPGFETNQSRSPLNTSLVTLNQRISDNWVVGTPGSAGPSANFASLLTGGGHAASSATMLVNRATGPFSMPNNSSIGCAVSSDLVAVTPGETYSWGGWLNLNPEKAVFPAGGWGARGEFNLLLYDAAGTLLGLFAAGVVGCTPMRTITEFNPQGWQFLSNYGTIPNVTQTGPGMYVAGIPAFVRVQCNYWWYNQSGSVLNVPAQNVSCYYDDVFLFPQWSPNADEIAKQGSISNTYTGGLTYTCDTASITWSWNISASRTDRAMSVNNYASSQAITGLASGTSYNFYPFIDESIQLVTMVASGGTGTPSWAHLGTSVAWTQEQSRSDHYPLSTGPLPAATTTSGGGGGGGGGVGGSCLREDVLVRERSRGVIAVSELKPGDWVACPVAEDTPDGWAQVTIVESAPGREWIHTFFSVDDWLPTTPGHPFTLHDGSMKRAALLHFEDEIPCVSGVTYVVEHALRKYDAMKVRVRINSGAHVFWAGMKAPVIQQHNFMPLES